jgi:PAS domain S-box-containing protein
MNPQRLKTVTPWPLVVLFFVLSGAAIVTGYLSYKSQLKHLLENSTQELSAIADLKVRQIIQWRNERKSDGVFFSHNTALSEQFYRFISGDNSKKLREYLLQEMKAVVESYDYKNALLLDSACKVRLFFPDKDTVIGDYLEPRLRGIIKKGEVVLTDLHQTGKISFTHLDLIVPLKNPETKDSTVNGLLVLRIDPQKVIYPAIKSWPVISKTSETLLVHREGDEIVYLTELRHTKNSELGLRLPIATEKLAAAMALQGKQVSTDAVDYRGIPVIASMKKVPDSPWYLVAKVDREEALSTLKEYLRQVKIIVILSMLTTGFFLGLLWWYQRVKFYRSKYEAELDRLALVRHYDYILKYANDIIFLLDGDFSILEANDKAIETYQYERKELTGQHISKLRADSELKKLEKVLEKVNEIGYSTFETIHKRKDGTVFPVEISARRVDIEGIQYYHAISRDITERKQAENTLRESEERFRKIFEDSPFCMVMTGKDLGIIRANSAFCKMIGYSEEELKGLTFKNLTHPDYIAGDEISLLRLVTGDIPVYQTQKRYLRSDRSIIWGSTTISIIRNNDGEVHFFLAMVEDVTARRIAETELEKSFSLQKATLESTADGILVVDNDGKIVQYNQKFTDMWRIPQDVMGLKNDEAALKFVLDQVKYPDQFLDQVKKLYSDPDAITSDLLEFSDGRFFERYSQPQRIGGNTAGRVWSFRDITERKRAEAELIASKEKAEESDKLKTAFLHNVSHEIRTPMNAILGFSTLLSEPGISDADRKQFIDIIFQSGSQLLSIINDIVDLASIESGQVRINILEINLNTTLRRINEQFSYKEKPQKVVLTLKTALPNLEAEIMTDGTKLVQIISNLINNAFKFTKKGAIDFGYELKGEFLEFFVRDTGIGIPREHQSKIFDRFYQVDNAISRQYTGTGLGLSICKAYAELLGGTIWVESNPGEGTIFYFTIPYKKKS